VHFEQLLQRRNVRREAFDFRARIVVLGHR
jgi:hypothetical protein